MMDGSRQDTILSNDKRKYSEHRYTIIRNYLMIDKLFSNYLPSAKLTTKQVELENILWDHFC